MEKRARAKGGWKKREKKTSSRRRLHPNLEQKRERTNVCVESITLDEREERAKSAPIGDDELFSFVFVVVVA